MRRQLGDFMMRNQKVLASHTGSIHGEEDEAAHNVSSSNEEEPFRRGRREKGNPLTLMILELKSLNLKVK